MLASGVLPPSYLLLPERVFCAQFAISRMTLRQAMGLLDREGLVDSRQGVGTVVMHRRLSRQQQEPRSFSEEVRARRAPGIAFDLARTGYSGAPRAGLFRPAGTAKGIRNSACPLEDCEPFALELTRSVFRGDRYSIIVRAVHTNKSILQGTSS